MAVEEMLGAKGAALDDRAKEERLRQIRAVEEAYQVSWARLMIRSLTYLNAPRFV